MYRPEPSSKIHGERMSKNIQDTQNRLQEDIEGDGGNGFDKSRKQRPYRSKMNKEKKIKKILEEEMRVLKNHVDRVMIRLTNKIIKVKDE